MVVVAGPNSGGPVFAQDRYDAQVSEGAAVKSTIITLTVSNFYLLSSTVLANPPLFEVLPYMLQIFSK